MILHKCATPRLNIQLGDTGLPASDATIDSAEMAKTRASVYNATFGGAFRIAVCMAAITCPASDPIMKPGMRSREAVVWGRSFTRT
jgi:hypothetical protein